MIQKNDKIPAMNQSLTQIPNAPQFSYISGAKFFSYIMRVYGGGFRLAIMRVYICGKIFALHNTHIKYGENPKIITNTIYIHIYTYNYIYIITFLQ